MSYFTDSSEAERYAASRPYFHPLAIERARQKWGLDGRVRLAVDIACGTGQSAAALAAIADTVVALDISWHMLRSARPDARVRYAQARSEAMPLPSEIAPIVTCALAFHWFDRASFLGEAWRILEANGRLLIYNNGFTGAIREAPAFRDWSHGQYLERFPVPPRDSRPFTAEEASAFGFAFIQEERYENDVAFTPEELGAYLVTQTNVAAAIKQGQVCLESASRWLREQVRTYFAGEQATCVFVTRAWTLQKQAIS